jgi:hypothetical protein
VLDNITCLDNKLFYLSGPQGWMLVEHNMLPSSTVIRRLMGAYHLGPVRHMSPLAKGTEF